MSRRLKQENCEGNSPGQAGDHQWNHHAAGQIEMLAIRPGAGRDSHPERDRVGGIRGNRFDSGKRQCRKRDETSAASDDGADSPVV